MKKQTMAKYNTKHLPYPNYANNNQPVDGRQEEMALQVRTGSRPCAATLSKGHLIVMVVYCCVGC